MIWVRRLTVSSRQINNRTLSQVERGAQVQILLAIRQRGSFFFSRLKAEESGQAITEYILLLSAAAAAALTISRGVLKGIYDGVLSLGGQLEKDLKTGRASVTIWKN